MIFLFCFYSQEIFAVPPVKRVTDTAELLYYAVFCSIASMLSMTMALKLVGWVTITNTCNMVG